jgi:hypothetical protein
MKKIPSTYPSTVMRDIECKERASPLVYRNIIFRGFEERWSELPIRVI